MDAGGKIQDSGFGVEVVAKDEEGWLGTAFRDGFIVAHGCLGLRTSL